MSYNWEERPALLERYRPQINSFCITLAVGGIGTLVAIWVASFSY